MMTPATDNAQAPARPHEDIVYPSAIPFVLVHLACLGALWTGVPARALVLGVVLYVARMLAVTAGYHRYFSHRAYKLGRGAQLVLACAAQSSAQRGILWWAATHRRHHRWSDAPEDVHSPRQHGFWYAHVGWIFATRNHRTDLAAVPDLARYPELVWLDRHPYLPATVLGGAVWLAAGWPGLVVGFLWSTTVLFHGTFLVNSLAHVRGRRRYVTGDDSRNNWLLALIACGEGWHNNHHACPRAARQGFLWWEIDLTFYLLAALSWIGVARELGEPPADVVRNERPLPRALVERVARQVAQSFPPAELAARVRDAWALAPPSREPRAGAPAGWHLPHVPSLAEVRRRAEQMLAATPSMETIAARARTLLVQAVMLELRLDPTSQPQGAP